MKKKKIQNNWTREQKMKVGKMPRETLLWFRHMGISGKNIQLFFNQNISYLVCKFQQLRKHPTQSPQTGVSMFYVNTS